MFGREVFLDSLMLHGATRIFGNPGTTETPLLDSLADYPGIEYIFHLHEGIAVGSANFYAQASGKTAVVNMHVAPGLGNAIGMMYGAMKNCSPLIVTAGAQDTRVRLRDPLLGHDLVAMAEPVTKWSVQVEHADEMGPIMRRAFKVANEHPAGPVFVALPINVLEQQTEIGATRAGDLMTSAKADDEALRRLANFIRAGKNVGIVAGDDVVRDGARDALVALSEKIGAGVHKELVCGHFPFPSRHPHFRGRLGADAVGINQALGDYDLVIMIGGSFFEEVWYTDTSPFADDVTLVHLEASAARLGHKYPTTLGILGHIKDALTRLIDLVGDEPIYQQRCDALVSQHETAQEKSKERFESLKDLSPMTPARAMFELSKAVPDDAVIAEEAVTSVQDVHDNFDVGGTTTFYGCRGGGIGQAMAGCVGTAVAHPDQMVLGITGDGSSMYSIQSLWTAAHHSLNVLFVILANREYRVLKHNTDQYRRRFNVPSNKPYVYMDLKPELGFCEMAAGMGVPGRQISDPTEIAEAVAEAMATEGPYLLELVIQGLET